MKIEKLAQLPKESIIQILEILRLDQRTIDGLWFLAVEDAYGLDRAMEFDSNVWEKIGRINAKRLQKAFKLEAGIPGLIRAIEFDPLWLFFGYEVKQLSDTQAVIQFSHCPAQSGRLRMGKEAFPCRRVEEGYFSSFVKVIDPRITVQCGFCPPEKGSNGFWCQWYFSIEENK